MNRVFIWDPFKAASNFDKHDISFEEALSVFRDPLARIFGDEEHSSMEPREIIIGQSSQRRLLLVAFVERGAAIRLISARRATRLERKDYEENTGH